MSGVSSLFSRSLDVLVKHIDKVSSLGGLPEEVLVALFQVTLSASLQYGLLQRINSCSSPGYHRVRSGK